MTLLYGFRLVALRLLRFVLIFQSDEPFTELLQNFGACSSILRVSCSAIRWVGKRDYQHVSAAKTRKDKQQLKVFRELKISMEQNFFEMHRASGLAVFVWAIQTNAG